MERRWIGCVSLLWSIIYLDRILIGLSDSNDKYLGCFKDTGNPRAFKGYVEHLAESLTPHKCTELCYNKGYLYSATQNKEFCFCGDKHPKPTLKVTDDRCSKPCSGNTAMKCGGVDAISVTETGIPDFPEAKYYLGCYHDTYQSFNDISMIYEKTNTPRRCMNVCLHLGYKYSGVESSKKCKCGREGLNSELSVGGDECQWPCTGDATDNCGGNKKIALYSTQSIQKVTKGSQGEWPPPGKKRYYVETQKQGDWHESLMACLRNNTRLATVDNLEEFKELVEAIKLTGKRLGNFYLSASDVGREGHYVWVTNGKVLSGAKGPMWPDTPGNKQPDNWEGKEDCIEIWERYESEGYQLNDRPCTLKGNYVCEYFEE